MVWGGQALKVFFPEEFRLQPVRRQKELKKMQEAGGGQIPGLLREEASMQLHANYLALTDCICGSAAAGFGDSQGLPTGSTSRPKIWR